TGSAWTTRTTRAALATGTVGKGRLEDALQLGGLVAGQLAAGHFAGDQIVDLRLQVVGRRSGAAGLIAGPAALQRRVDVGERRRQGVLIGRSDRAGCYFSLQLGLQFLQW